MGRRKQSWKIGDLFSVPMLDSRVALGQIVGREPDVLNSVVVALFEQAYDSTKDVPAGKAPDWTTVFSVLFTTRDLLDSGVWQVVGSAEVQVPKDLVPHEHLRRSGFVGARVVGSGIVTKLVNAFQGLAPWDDWKEPDYLDRLLVSPEKKPAGRIVYKLR